MSPLPGDVLGRVNTRSMWEPYIATATAPDGVIAQWREVARRDIIVAGWANRRAALAAKFALGDSVGRARNG